MALRKGPLKIDIYPTREAPCIPSFRPLLEWDCGRRPCRPSSGACSERPPSLILEIQLREVLSVTPKACPICLWVNPRQCILQATSSRYDLTMASLSSSETLAAPSSAFPMDS